VKIVLYEESAVNSQRDREASVEHLLRRLRQARLDLPPVSSQFCLDAEMLAAWADGALTGNELAAAEAHASNCSHCQALLAAMARTTPAPNATEDRWWSGLALRWLVPLTAAATAVAIWVAVPRNPPALVFDSNQAGNQAATSQDLPQPSVTTPNPQQPSAAAERPSAFVKLESQLRPRRNESPAELKDQAAAPAAEPSEARTEGAQLDQERQAADGVTRTPEAAGARPLAAAPASAASESTFNKSELSARRTSSVSNAIAIEITSPDPSTRWRIGAGGSVQYSSNGGSTWEALSTGVNADLTAGSAPSTSTCWLVGRAGTVLLSTDGRRWQRVPFPEPADLVLIRAADARTASVTTADGRTFNTANGGRTWDR
jgi:Photosynthesis system II assembly factor YCF48/Putative zinc-finger